MATNEEIRIMARESRTSFLAMNFVSEQSLPHRLINPLKQLLDTFEKQIDDEARKDEARYFANVMHNYFQLNKILKKSDLQPIIDRLRSGGR